MSKPCYGVVQRSESREAKDGIGSIPWTEWLSSRDPVDWTRNPAEAFVFGPMPAGRIHPAADGRLKTGFDLACEFADGLNAAEHTTKHHACIRNAAGERPATDPPMPRVVDRRFKAVRSDAGQAQDWHARAVNCGVE